MRVPVLFRALRSSFSETKCPVCFEALATELQGAYVALLSCRHPVCMGCLCELRRQCRQGASEELDESFGDVPVPKVPATVFCCALLARAP